MNIFKKLSNFLTEVKAELKKVAWSSRREVLGSTAVVIAITALMTVYIGIIDLIFSRFLTLVMR